MRQEGRQGEYGGSGLSMYPQRPYVGHGSQRGQDGRDQREMRTHDMRHHPQQGDPHGTQQQLHQRPPDAKTGERGASNTNPYTNFDKGGGVGTRIQTNQSPSAAFAGSAGSNNLATDEPGKKTLTAASIIDAIITQQINKNVDGDRRTENMGLLTRLQTSDSPRSQVVPAVGHLPPQAGQPPSQGRGLPGLDPGRTHLHGQRSPPYKPHKAMGRYEADSQQGRPQMSGGSITAGIPAVHHQHHPSSTGSTSMSSSSSEASHSRSSSTVSPNAAALSSEALRSITLGEHIDYIILQDYNGKNPRPGLSHPPKDDGAGIPRRKSSASCLMLSSQSLPRWKQGMPSLY